MVVRPVKPVEDPSAPPQLYVQPPFFKNAPGLKDIPPEVSGGALLETLRRRLGWTSYAGKRVLDFGCGVRFARTIANLGLEFGKYVGVDVNRPAIEWLQANLTDPRFEFAHMDAHNPLYGDSGTAMADAPALPVSGPFDAACMYSVITHQDPDEALRTFALLRPVAGRLYFTAALDTTVDRYVEGDPERPRLFSRFNPEFLQSLVQQAGWTVERIYAPSHYQQHAVVSS